MDELFIYGQPSYLLEKTSIVARMPKDDSFLMEIKE